MATSLGLLGQCAKSALKQSDGVANSNVQGLGRCTGLSWETAVQTLFFSNMLYVQGTKDKIEGPHVQSVTASSVWSEYRIFG